MIVFKLLLFILMFAFGSMDWKNAWMDAIEGDLKGRSDDNGTFNLRCGLVYEGEILNGFPHGRGKYIDERSGDTYEGEFPFGTTGWFSLYQGFYFLYP